METDSLQIARWAYGFAAIVFTAFAAYLWQGWRGGRLGGRVLLAVALSAAWAVAEFSGLLWWSGRYSHLLASALDFARLAAWAYFLAGLLAVTEVEQHVSARLRGFLPAGAVLFALACLGGLIEPSSGAQLRWQPLGHLLLAIWFLALLEQIYRNFPAGSRWGIKPVIIGLASSLCFDIYLYADAVMLGRLDDEVMAIRGAVHAIAMPLVAMSAVRSRDWTFRITLSRELVFHTATLAASGAYLLLIAAAGYYVRWFGGNWGRALQAGLFFCGLVLLVFLVFSGSARAKLRVLINKHLFAYRYDYRNAWLRFTQALTDVSAERSLGQRVIGALGDFVESPGGVLWLRSEDGFMRPQAQLNLRAENWEEPSDSAMCQLMAERGWILNLEEWRSRPDLYGEARMPDWLRELPEAWLLVPLGAGQKLGGFVLLANARVPVEVNWEVLDLLKTAGAQAASYLTLAHTTEALLEARKFDSFNRMSAFVVHDLKNLVAQLSLMLKNADRHKANPEFQDDMLMTVANVAERMRGLMQQLQNKTPIEARRSLDLAALCRTAQRLARNGAAELDFDLAEGLWVNAHADRLERIIGHVVQNALEATPSHGKVEVRTLEGAGAALLSVSDNGCGMSPEFVRERLFRPFQTTKNTGMGIGTYEVQQYVVELGGRVSVDSEPGRGTTFTIQLPLASRAESAAA